MDILSILSDMPWWYILTMVCLTVYYAWRGVRYVRAYQIPSQTTSLMTPPASGSTTAPTSPALAAAPLSDTDRWGIWYVQEIIFKVVITISSFYSLYVGYRLSKLVALADLKDGTAILLVFLYLWGVLGICGYLTHLIMVGKYPGSK